MEEIPVPQLRLTKSKIDQLPAPADGQIIYRDTQLKGFGLRVGPRSRVFIAETKVNHRTVRVKLGDAAHVTPERARQLALKKLGEMAEGRNPNQERRASRSRTITLKEAAESYYARRAIGGTTLAGYRRTFENYLGDWANKSLSEITRTMVVDRHAKLTEQKRPVTANNVMRHLRAVYNFALALHPHLPPNPVRAISDARLWHREHRRRTVIAPQALPRWWAAVMLEPPHSRDFLLVALFTGMRRSEIATLRWEHVDLEARTLTVPKTKNGDPLVLPLSDFVTDLLTERRKNLPKAVWVFPGREGHCPMQEPKRFTDRVSLASGVEFTLHDLRRTFITIAESLDISAYALKRMLNHRSDADVTGGYIIVGVDRLRAPVERTAERLLELAHPAEVSR
jgi:integrase